MDLPKINVSSLFNGWRTTMVAVASLLFAFAALPAPARAASAKTGAKSHVVFLITEDPDNYEAHKSIPPFAENLQRTQGYQVTVIKGQGQLGEAVFPGLVETLAKADLVVVFCRRVALPAEQMDALKNFVKSGKPLVGIRTANHAFAPRTKIAEGHIGWPEFVADILGCENTGYGAIKDGIKVTTPPSGVGHPILKGLPAQWFSPTNIYKQKLLDPSATVLLNGEAAGKIEPLAWTRMVGKSRIFYTSLGHPEEFKNPDITTLLTNGIRWALNSK